MRFKIENKVKQDIFVALFQLLKNWNAHVTISFETNKLHIQAMDKSHVCLANININSIWFTEYECLENTKLSVDSSSLSILMNFSLKHNSIEFKFDKNVNPDKLYINFINILTDKKSGFDHFFELPLIDIEEDSLGIPDVDYDVEFTIETKKFVEVLAELNTFGSDLNIKCNETSLDLFASGELAKLKVNIPIDDLNEFAIADGEEFNLSFSLNHICKMCTSNKLGETINVSLSSEFPMSLKYNLGDNSLVVFYIAPKVSD